MITYYEVLDVLLVNDVIQSEPWSHAEKEESNKTCCNQNIPVLPLSDDCSADRPQPFLQLFYATHQGFPISEWTHPIILIGIKLFQLFIYLLSDAKPL